MSEVGEDSPVPSLGLVVISVSSWDVLQVLHSLLMDICIGFLCLLLSKHVSCCLILVSEDLGLMAVGLPYLESCFLDLPFSKLQRERAKSSVLTVTKLCWVPWRNVRTFLFPTLCHLGLTVVLVMPEPHKV